MSGPIKQLRISLLIVLEVTTVDLVTSAAGSLRSGTFLPTLGDWTLTTAVFCALVALLLLDRGVIWSLLTTGSAHSWLATGADIARNTALFFGIVAVPPRILAGALLVAFT